MLVRNLAASPHEFKRRYLMLAFYALPLRRLGAMRATDLQTAHSASLEIGHSRGTLVR